MLYEDYYENYEILENPLSEKKKPFIEKIITKGLKKHGFKADAETVSLCLKYVEEANPENGDHSNWLAKILTDPKGGFNPKEDIQKIKSFLERFNIAKRKKIIPPEFRDTNKFKSFPELYKSVSPYLNQYSTRNMAGLKRNEYKIVFDGKKHVVLKITDWRAAQKAGQNTNWCIVGKQMAQEYTEEGPLYLFLEKNKAGFEKIALLHDESEQFMDVNDDPIRSDFLKGRKEIIPFLEEYGSSVLCPRHKSIRQREDRLFEIHVCPECICEALSAFINDYSFQLNSGIMKSSFQTEYYSSIFKDRLFRKVIDKASSIGNAIYQYMSISKDLTKVSKKTSLCYLDNISRIFDIEVKYKGSMSEFGVITTSVSLVSMLLRDDSSILEKTSLSRLDLTPLLFEEGLHDDEAVVIFQIMSKTNNDGRYDSLFLDMITVSNMLSSGDYKDIDKFKEKIKSRPMMRYIDLSKNIHVFVHLKDKYPEIIENYLKTGLSMGVKITRYNFLKNIQKFYPSSSENPFLEDIANFIFDKTTPARLKEKAMNILKEEIKNSIPLQNRILQEEGNVRKYMYNMYALSHDYSSNDSIRTRDFSQDLGTSMTPRFAHLLKEELRIFEEGAGINAGVVRAAFTALLSTCSQKIDCLLDAFSMVAYHDNVNIRKLSGLVVDFAKHETMKKNPEFLATILKTYLNEKERTVRSDLALALEYAFKSVQPLVAPKYDDLFLELIKNGTSKKDRLLRNPALFRHLKDRHPKVIDDWLVSGVKEKDFSTVAKFFREASFVYPDPKNSPIFEMIINGEIEPDYYYHALTFIAKELTESKSIQDIMIERFGSMVYQIIMNFLVKNKPLGYRLDNTMKERFIGFFFEELEALNYTHESAIIYATYLVVEACRDDILCLLNIFDTLRSFKKSKNVGVINASEGVQESIVDFYKNAKGREKQLLKKALKERGIQV